MRSEQPRAFVTGGTGFIGSILVEDLAKNGWRVRCLVRPRKNRAFCFPSGVETINGDILDADSLNHLEFGEDIIFHLAGKTKARGLDEFMQTNRDGTSNLLKAIKKSNTIPQSLVLVSSLSAAGPSRDGKPLTEDFPPQPVSEYGQSKLASEQVVLDFDRPYPAVILRPSVVYGPREKDILEIIRWVNRGIKLVPRQKRIFSAIHVNDLIQGLIAAGKKPQNNRTYFIGDGVEYDWDQCLNTISRLLGKKSRNLKISIPTARHLAQAAAFCGMKDKGSFLLDKLRELAHPFWVCSINRAREELGFSPSLKFEEGMAQTLDWYRQQGWI